MNAKEIADWTEQIPGWIDFQVGGWRTYTYDERLHLAEAGLKCVPEGGLIVEIGSFVGLSTSVLMCVARERKARLASVDMFMWNGERAEPELRKVLCMFPDVSWRFYWTSSEMAYKVATTSPATVGGVTCPAFVDHNINLLHIDGDHGAAAKDCELWVPHVVSGGMVAFHDANPDPRAEYGVMVVRDANLHTGEWRTIWHSLNENCLLVREKP